MDKDLRIALEHRARTLGFDSAQAYIRVWAKAESEGRKLDFDSSAIVLSPDADSRYKQIVADLDAEKESGKIKSFHTVDEFMKDLRA